MKHLDDYAINQIGIPSMVLMERAALAVANCMKKHINYDDKIIAVCGTGNNGADAIAVARILKLQGYDTDVVIVGNTEKCSKESNQQINIAENLGISIYNNVNISEYTIIIDGMFGIGLNQPVRGNYLDYIKSINNEENTVFSVDVPSGVSATNGKLLGDAIKANFTITFGYNKIGLILYPGCQYAGEVMVADIGFPQIKIEKNDYKYYIYENCDLSKLPKRTDNSHKGSYGKVLIIAGSKGMNGACFLSSKAAYRTGAGLVKALIPRENRTIMQTMLPEAIISTYENETTLAKAIISKNKKRTELQTEDVKKILKEISWANVIAIGPGLGTDKVARQILELVLNNAKVPVVIDADGINILAKTINENLNGTNNSIKERIKVLKKLLPENTILTPHLKELSRLLNLELNEIKDNILEVANVCTQDNGITFAIKDARTVVAYENNRFINTSGNSGMATGGSGDVLTGIIASLIAQGLSPSESASLGVYIHGLAGDIAVEEKNQYSLIASDIIDSLANI